MIRNQDIRKDGESTGCGFAGNNREEFLVSGPRSGNSKAKMPMRTTGGNWQTSARYYPPRRWRLPDSLRNVFRIGFGRIGVSLSGGRRIAPLERSDESEKGNVFGSLLLRNSASKQSGRSFGGISETI